MRSKIRKIIVFIIVALTFPSIVLAEDITCDYENGLKLYYKNGTIDYDYQELSDKWYTYSILHDAGVDMYYHEEVKLNQIELEETYGQFFCPENVYICEETKWGIEHPSLVNLANTFGLHLTGLLQVLSAGLLDFTKYYNHDIWGLLSLGKKDLYIMSQSTYEDEYKDKVGGSFNFLPTDNWATGAEWCTLGDDIVVAEQTVDTVCGLVWSGVGTVIDTIVSDDKLLLGYKDLSCTKIKYPEDGPYSSLNIECWQVDLALKQLETYVEEYNACESNDYSCRSKANEKIDEKAALLNNQCNSILSNFSYIDSEKACINKCLSIHKTLDKMENNKIHGQCGLSGRLIIWIANIVRWVKYIVPVLIIVLGILDFMKAIGADKEDEMKKAQQRFIRRLIAAVLIFILPLIIEFVLNKMGFDSNGCGIINL